ncbi:hypothetical protein TI39_contig856g00002 [Zymoseptoria brevis]|uniref:SNF2 N-terminal domain-containing protein n=1 Tax=Zymoseptoria brevis TaxID=1047168 RepID=A0A0F4GG24_9PEZI|nr:hypothetical protein TI39_contig856g00002 [Zymoseptoria brevis]
MHQEQKDMFEKILDDLDYGCPKVQGGIIEDVPGMGKTHQTCAFFNYWSQHASHLDADGKPDHRPTLLVVPDGYVYKQWAQLINDKFPRIQLVLAKSEVDWATEQVGGTKDFEKATRFETLSIQQACTGKDLPNSLKYIFDTNDEKASRTIIACTYTTWRKRVMSAKAVTATDHALFPDGCENWHREKPRAPLKKYELRDTSKRWENAFKMTILDEGYAVRNNKTQMHWSIRHLKADIN